MKMMEGIMSDAEEMATSLMGNIRGRGMGGGGAPGQEEAEREDESDSPHSPSPLHGIARLLRVSTALFKSGWQAGQKMASDSVSVILLEDPNARQPLRRLHRRVRLESLPTSCDSPHPLTAPRTSPQKSFGV